MKMTLTASLAALLMLLSCGSNPPTPDHSNTELTVHYNGKEILRKNSRYISENHLRSILDRKKEVIIIFSADWCSSCTLTRQAIDQAKVSINVYYLNLDESWAKQLAILMNIRTIPVMFHVGKAGETLGVRVGPSEIVSYLALRY